MNDIMEICIDHRVTSGLIEELLKMVTIRERTGVSAHKIHVYKNFWINIEHKRGNVYSFHLYSEGKRSRSWSELEYKVTESRARYVARCFVDQMFLVMRWNWHK